MTGAIWIAPDIGWVRAAFLVTLCFTPQLALWTTRHFLASRRIRAGMPVHLLEQRFHGNLDSPVDGAGLPALDRPAVRRGRLADRRVLTDLIAIPSVRILHGVGSGDATMPRVNYAVSAGRVLLLIEAVAWPPGRYETDQDGRVRCGARYIGQTVAPLASAVSHWRRALPRTHRVHGLVVVHPCAEGELGFPTATAPDVAWVSADEALETIRRHLPAGSPTVNRHTLAALIASTGSAALPDGFRARRRHSLPFAARTIGG